MSTSTMSGLTRFSSLLSILGAILLSGHLVACSTPPVQDDTTLPRSTPEAQGVSSAGILSFLDAVAAQRQEPVPQVEVHSFMLVRNGQVITEGWWDPYSADQPHMLFSLSKSFTSTAVGLAVKEGLLTLDDRIISFFPEDLPDSVSENLAAMTIRDLLTMSAGQEREGGPNPDWIKTFLAEPVLHRPGTTFRYNSRATFMLSAILQKLTRQNLQTYLTPRLFEPLGIEDVAWDANPQGIDMGGSGLHLKTEDLAKFGLLYLQDGVWKGEQIIPADWVKDATSLQISTRDAYVAEGEDPTHNDWAQGYGYKFWQTTHGAYRGDGAFGQFVIVLPDLNAVVVLTSGSRSMQDELNLVWEYLLPAFKETPLPPDEQAQAALQEKLASLTLLPEDVQQTSPTAADVSGKTYMLDENAAGIQAVSITFGEDSCRFTLQIGATAYTTPCGIDHWVTSPTSIEGPGNGADAWKVASTGWWADNHTFVMRWQFYETPFSDTVTLHFQGDEVEVSFERNIGGQETRPVLHGRMAPS